MKNFYILSLLVFKCFNVTAQACLCITVEDNFKIALQRPVSVELDKEKKDCLAKNIVLMKRSQNKIEVIPYQIDPSQENKIWFMHTSIDGAKINYCFENKIDQNEIPLFKYKKENGDLKMSFGNQSLIHYRYEIKFPSEGVDKLYQKSG